MSCLCHIIVSCNLTYKEFIDDMTVNLLKSGHLRILLTSNNGGHLRILLTSNNGGHLRILLTSNNDDDQNQTESYPVLHCNISCVPFV